MSGHTPGPWSLETVATSCGSCHKIGPFPGAGHRREVHACVYADGIRIGMDESNPTAKELLANARLIAAAPVQHAELLACKQFLEDMHTQTAEWTVAESQKRHAAVCAVIAAATGESHE